MSNHDKLLKMKKEIEAAKVKANQLEGAINQLQHRLKSEFGAETVAEGEILGTKLDQEIAQLEEEISQQVEKLERQYEWKL